MRRVAGLIRRALQANPLDRRLRDRVGYGHLLCARDHAEAGRFDEARAEYQAALSFHETGSQSSVFCKWAACEFKAGDAERGEELLRQALAEAASRLAVAHSMLIEVIRLKLPRSLKTRFDKEFKDALAEPPTAAAALAVTATMSAHQLAGVTYHGQKTHDKKVLAYLDQACQAEFTEDQLERVCVALLSIQSGKQLRAFCKKGQQQFPQSPMFFFLEAESYIAKGPAGCPTWKVIPLLENAQRLAEAQPTDEKQKNLLRDIRQRRDMLGLFSPMAGGYFQDLFGEMLDAFDDDYDDDDDWDYNDFDDDDTW